MSDGRSVARVLQLEGTTTGALERRWLEWGKTRFAGEGNAFPLPKEWPETRQ
ncbi:MAG TPA: hypothetical protein PKB10_05655 [Tepidisphaeraceae bacterium]|nr:hypothetical protein [Tepidisphaeraceae bacterium]